MAGKILWAVDAFADDAELTLKTAHLLKTWGQATHPSIEPVTVLSPDQLKIPESLFKDKEEDVLEYVTRTLTERLGKLDLPGCLPPRVLLSPDVSLRNAVEKLIAHGRKAGAELIVVASHSKAGVSHFLFGSFAETLVLQSEIPVFIVTPRMHEIRKIDHVLFPTDLSKASRAALDRVIPIAREWKARIHLYHKLDYLTPYTMSQFQADEVYAEFLARDAARRKKEVSELAAAVKAAGVDVEAEVDESPGLTVWKGILARSERLHAGILAMASQTGPVASAILGSNTRQVIRQTSSPLWIIHPSGK